MMWTCFMSHMSAFFFLTSQSKCNQKCSLLLHSATTTTIYCLHHAIFFLGFGQKHIMNKWQHEVGKNRNIQKCDWSSMRVKNKIRNINSCMEHNGVFSVALQNKNIHISVYFQMKIWFYIVLFFACDCLHVFVAMTAFLQNFNMRVLEICLPFFIKALS